MRLRIERIIKVLITVISVVVFITMGVGAFVFDWLAVDKGGYYFFICLIILAICQYLLLPLLHKDRWKNVKRVLREEIEEILEWFFRVQPFKPVVFKGEERNFSKGVIRFRFWGGICGNLLMWLLLPQFVKMFKSVSSIFITLIIIIVFQGATRLLMIYDFKCRDFKGKKEMLLKWRRLSKVIIPGPFIEIIYYFSVAKKIPLLEGERKN